VEDRVWSLLRLFRNSTYADRWVRDHKCLQDEHFERITNGILQAEEYFRAASYISLATSPVLLYYGMLHLADVVIAANGKQQPTPHHGLKRVREGSSDPVDHLQCRVMNNGVFASFNNLVYRDVSPVRNPLGKEGTIFPASVAVALEYPQREAILGKTVHFDDFIGSIPDLSQHCAHSKRVHCLTVPLHDIQLESTQGKHTLSLALSRESKSFVEEYLTTTLGMEELTEGPDLVVFRLVSGGDSVSRPHLRSPLKGRPHIVGGLKWQISEAATMLLLMFIFGDLARYQSNLWMKFVSQSSEENEIVNEFVNVAAVKFPYLVLTQLRRQLLLFAD
jgi:hypothetical protein